jgi:hypothetical protein
VDVTITGTGLDTILLPGGLSFGEGILVGNVNVVSPTTLTATLVIQPTADLGFRDVSVTTDTGTDTELDGFELFPVRLISCR